MRTSIPLLAAFGLGATLAGCGEASPPHVYRDSPALAVMESLPPAPATATEPARQSALSVAIPRIAYTYGYRFRLEAGTVAPLQERHLGLCRRLGPVRCRVLSMRRGDAGGGVNAALNLQVAAPLAEAFGRRLATISTEAGADTIDRSITAEDLSRQMIDSEARIRTRETLIRRLTSLLETRSGNIQQAVDAERAINTAQEELEAARAWLGEMRGRVAMSAVEIGYETQSPMPASLRNPIGDAFAQLGSMSASSLAAMILAVGIIFPWVVLGAAVFLVVRRVRRRREEPEAAYAPPEASA